MTNQYPDKIFVTSYADGESEEEGRDGMSEEAGFWNTEKGVKEYVSRDFLMHGGSFEWDALVALLEVYPNGVTVWTDGQIWPLVLKPEDVIGPCTPNDFANLGDDYLLWVSNDCDNHAPNDFIDAIYCGDIRGNCVITKREEK